MSQEILSPAAILAKELNIKQSQVQRVTELLEEGATVPFIARYRKEVTGGLDDKQLRTLALRLHYLQEMDVRRQAILQAVREQEKLTPELEAAILSAENKTRLEDLYLPFRPKRHNKAEAAKAAGLLPLAEALLKDLSLNPTEAAQAFVDPEKGVETVALALEGARHLLLEHFTEDAGLLHELRETLWNHAALQSKKSSLKAAEKAAKSKSNKKKPTADKYADYFEYAEAIKKIPSHRALALFRGRREGALQLSLHLSEAERYLERLASWFQVDMADKRLSPWLKETLALAWKQKMFPKLELELLARLRESADEEGIRVFARNLHDLLMAAPAGPKIIIGLDPGIRTGVKVAAIDATGKLLDYTAIFPFSPQNEKFEAIAELARFATKYQAQLFSIGNGTASRETERLVTEMQKMYPDIKIAKMVVSEAGASVYSASELASLEFPDIDVSIRGAISIARRLQDPLAELVKIEPKSIGVGQYQHDVNQNRMALCLEGVVEDCVNLVGVDVNTASVPLLTKVSGLNESLAKNLVQYRNEHGAFSNREQLKQVPRMGEKSFQLAAGFLRIQNGDNPLDASAVHPESYPLVEKILAHHQVNLDAIIGNKELLQSVNADQFVDESFGLPTIADILKELEKPGRDPRPQFKTVNFQEGIESIEHLSEGMQLEGVVTNVTNFGAFVDIGVHQDGLVHISSMKQRTNDPHSLVKAGDIIKVRVIEVDKARKRIGLSMRLTEEKKPAPIKAAATIHATPSLALKKKPRPPAKPVQKTFFNTAMADAFARLKGLSKSDD